MFSNNDNRASEVAGEIANYKKMKSHGRKIGIKKAKEIFGHNEATMIYTARSKPPRDK